MLCLDFRFRPFVSMKMRVYPSTSVYTLLFIDRINAKRSVMGVCTVVPSREIHHLIVLVLALYSQSLWFWFWFCLLSTSTTAT